MSSAYEDAIDHFKKVPQQTKVNNNVEININSQEPKFVVNEINQTNLCQANMHLNIPELNPNVIFHQKEEGLINRNIQLHIQKWETYEQDSKEIQQFYRDLEHDHVFIQWIFPNLFKSQFNTRSSRLTLEERNEIINSDKLTEFYLDNFRMFMRFLGIKVDLTIQSNDQFEMVDETQFKLCLLEYTHNLMRLQRVFASLSVLGQRELALSFLQFLKNNLNRLNAQNIYARKYQHYEMVKEEDNNSNICFENVKKFYFEDNLLIIWAVSAKILTRDLINAEEFLSKKKKDYSYIGIGIALIIAVIIFIAWYFH